MSLQPDQIDEAIERLQAQAQAKRCQRQLPLPPDGLQDPLQAVGEPGLLVIGQAAAYLGITDDQVAAFVQDGELSYINLGRGKKRARYRFTIPDLQAFIEHRRRREVLCRSTSPTGRRSILSTSSTVVSDFSALRAAQLAKKPKPSKP
jgi:excisionase family DNA binding protein